MFPHLYIHFPYCLKKCRYCDFKSAATSVEAIPLEEYKKALGKELTEKAALFTGLIGSSDQSLSRVATIYFGGGTPSLMRPCDIEDILRLLSTRCAIASDVEVTLECNPGTVDQYKIADFVKAGVTRFSFGIQSFDNRWLAMSGRLHDARQAKQVLTWALEQGALRVSADLIFGFPGQTLQDWEQDLDALFLFGPGHFSCYALTVETGTALADDIKTGTLLMPDSDLLAEMQLLTYEKAHRSGFSAYEISNFARPPFKSRHNLGYWHYDAYLGLGPGAVSQWHGIDGSKTLRLTNNWEATPLSEHTGYETEIIEPLVAQKECIMMGLRLADGIRVSEFDARFVTSLRTSYAQSIAMACANGLLVDDGFRIRPTPKGFLFNNRLVGLFF